MEEQKPKVGVGVMIVKDRKVLLGKRKGSHGAGEYEFPGGHLEYMESFEECARRETREECGIEIENIRFELLANVKKYAPKHYVHIGLIADWKSGGPRALEPDKCIGWNWYGLNGLPDQLFETCKLAAEMFLIFTLGRQDIFSFGDLGLKRAIGKLYGLSDSTREELETITRKWSPYQSWASRILWKLADE